MNDISISQRLRDLPASGRMLLKTLVSCSLATLALGVIFGLITAPSAPALPMRSRKPATA